VKFFDEIFSAKVSSKSFKLCCQIFQKLSREFLIKVSLPQHYPKVANKKKEVFLFLNLFSLNNGGYGFHGVVNGLSSEKNSFDILVVLVEFVVMVSVATLMSPQIIVQ